MRQLLGEAARIVIRIGGRRLGKEEAMEILHGSLSTGLGRSVRVLDAGVSSRLKHSQANAFRGGKPSPTMEHDFCFLVGAYYGPPVDLELWSDPPDGSPRRLGELRFVALTGDGTVL